jgi:hypothetical protein
VAHWLWAVLILLAVVSAAYLLVPQLFGAGHDPPHSWQDDARCSTDQMLVQEVRWMDAGVIPDNAQNESSKHVLNAVDDARAGGGTCDEVLARFQQLLT